MPQNVYLHLLQRRRRFAYSRVDLDPNNDGTRVQIWIRKDSISFMLGITIQLIAGSKI